MTTESQRNPEVLRERRRALEREREAAMAKRIRKDLYHNSPFYPEFWLDKLVTFTGLRARGEQNARDFQLRTVALAFENLPPAFDGFRVLLLSDMHFREEDPQFVQELCQFLSPVQADFCAFTGDYRYAFAGSFDHVFEGMRRLLECLPAHCGRAAVLGNHDLAAFVRPFKDMGLPVLMNEHISLDRCGERLWIAGVDDPHRFHCDDLAGATRGIPFDSFTILLAHSPELARHAPRHGIDLYLCGHTHGGQVCLPGGRPILLNARAARKYCAGLWQNGRTRGYTTAGLGTTDVPVRFYCPPEAVLIHLHRGPQESAPKP